MENEATFDGLRLNALTPDRLDLFLLSDSGKPIYSRNHNVDDEAVITTASVMQALCSVVADQTYGDQIDCISAGNTQIVFLRKSPLILVAASKTGGDRPWQLRRLLQAVRNAAISVVTQAQIEKVVQQRHNFDLRRILTGTDKLFNSLIDTLQTDILYLLPDPNEPFVLYPLPFGIRDVASGVLSNSCAGVKNVVFAMLLCTRTRRLISLARLHGYQMHAADVRLVINLVCVSKDSFLEADGSWLPICLPHFDERGFLHVHISTAFSKSESALSGTNSGNVAEACPDNVFLLLFTTDKDSVYELRTLRKKIIERLKQKSFADALWTAKSADACDADLLNDSLFDAGLRHFIYSRESSPKHAVQCALNMPFLHPSHKIEEKSKLHALSLYKLLLDKLERTQDLVSVNVMQQVVNGDSTDKKIDKNPSSGADRSCLFTVSHSTQTAIAWKCGTDRNAAAGSMFMSSSGISTSGLSKFLLLAVFDVTLSKAELISALEKLMKCVKRDETFYFVDDWPQFS